MTAKNYSTVQFMLQRIKISIIYSYENGGKIRL